MRGLNQADLIGPVESALDARLQRHVSHPLIIALSGGGDSRALLALTADWARRRGRRMIAVTIDHGLSPDSRSWSRNCRSMAEIEGVQWIGRTWEGPKRAAGLSAAARQARHALLAQVARSVGARVILMAHTADDIAEADRMRAEGTAIGHLKAWAPSPAWPEGRGLMLLRPLLGTRRADLRRWLVERDLDWIDDPANADPCQTRARARLALRDSPLVPIRTASLEPPPPDAIRPLPLGAGFAIPRDLPARHLAAVLVCASGGDRPPRGEALARLAVRIRTAENFNATLAGARVVATRENVAVGREPGRWPLPVVPLTAGKEPVWDGRYALKAREPGWTVGPGSGSRADLPPQDHNLIKTLPPPLRETVPILFRNGGASPILAWRGAEVRALAPRRLALALGEMTHEAELAQPVHGETPPPDLFSTETSSYETCRQASPSWKPQ